MARVTVYIADGVLYDADKRYLETAPPGTVSPNRSFMVSDALNGWRRPAARPEISERGRIEALRCVRALSDALLDVDLALTQAKPVKRRVRRYPAGRRIPPGA